MTDAITVFLLSEKPKYYSSLHLKLALMCKVHVQILQPTIVIASRLISCTLNACSKPSNRQSLLQSILTHLCQILARFLLSISSVSNRLGPRREQTVARARATLNRLQSSYVLLCLSLSLCLSHGKSGQVHQVNIDSGSRPELYI